jgi:hypothetical protein
MEKICFKCSLVKELSEFYKHKKMLDGHLNKCKDCVKKYSKENWEKKSKDENWLKSERKRNREKFYRLNYSEKHKQSTEERYKSLQLQRFKFPEKYKARNKSQKIISINGHNHHWSYNEEHAIDVIDLTIKNHLKAHRFIIYDQERMMYRTLDGVLLDTKERHLNYIMEKIKNEED